jgi:hypothetical protein
MEPKFPKKMHRRAFLRIAAATGITVVLGDSFFTLAPWLDYNGEFRRIWDTPFRPSVELPVQIREIIRYASLAPSGHNTQPWIFTVLKGQTIRVFPDNSRRLSIVDPNDRELWISLGCFVENLILSAQHAGYDADIAFPSADLDAIDIHLRPMSFRSDPILFQAIPHRRSTRSPYNGSSIPLLDLKKLVALNTNSDVSLDILTSPMQKKYICECIESADQRQYRDHAFIKELLFWLRFNKPEAFHSLDGLYTHCTGAPDLPRWLGEPIVARSGSSQGETDIKNARSSSGLIVISSAEDDKRHWIETGRLYERLALTFVTMNIKTAFQNQPIEVDNLRSELRSHLNLAGAYPQLLLRFGYAEAMPRSLRRPVEQITAGQSHLEGFRSA